MPFGRYLWKNSYPSSTNLFDELLSNLQFDIWEHQYTNETIIAFKGTDELVDLIDGDLTVILSLTYDEAKKKVEEYRKNLQKRGISKRQIRLTGHSLGGGLAISVSVKKGLDAIVFNTSPRTFHGFDKNESAMRKAIFQKGELLKYVRKFYPKFSEKIPSKDIIKTSFTYGEASNHRKDWLFESLLNHRIDLLAEGILRCSTSKDLAKIAEEFEKKRVTCYLD